VDCFFGWRWGGAGRTETGRSAASLLSKAHPHSRPGLTTARPPLAPLPQGYGLTECCAGAAIALADDFSQFATNGPPLPCIEIMFESVPGGWR
jgi:long-subunit acyl-CoA synthetase (AMP-forming)